jgi:hypothetical protein
LYLEHLLIEGPVYSNIKIQKDYLRKILINKNQGCFRLRTRYIIFKRIELLLITKKMLDGPFIFCLKNKNGEKYGEKKEKKQLSVC